MFEAVQDVERMAKDRVEFGIAGGISARFPRLALRDEVDEHSAKFACGRKCLRSFDASSHLVSLSIG